MSGNDAVALEELLGCSRELLEERFGIDGYRRLKDAVLRRAELLQRSHARRAVDGRARRPITGEGEGDDTFDDWRYGR